MRDSREGLNVRRHRVHVLVLAITGILGAGCPRPTAPDPSINRVEHGLLPFTTIEGDQGYSLTDRMAHYHVPGVSIAVIENARISWVRHYGVADVRTGSPVTDATTFNVGSMSKAVTAATILSLVGDGLVDLDAPVNQQLRSWRLPENEHTAEAAVTPRRLMNHSGGVVFSPGFPYRTEDLPTLRQVLEGEPPARSGPVRVDRVPGTGFQYSNPGYTILQQLAEDVTGMPFAEIVNQRIFEPLDMSHSTFVVPLPPALLRDAAMGHRTDGTVDDDVHRWVGHVAAGGLWTTAADYAAFVAELQRSLRGESNLVLTTELAKLMVEPQDAPEYGLGVFLRPPLGERRYVGHIGDGPGFVGGFTTDTRGEHGVVVLTNGQGGINLVREVRRAAAAVYRWPDGLPPARKRVEPDAGVIAQASGRYRQGFDGVLEIERSGDTLLMRWPDADTFELIPVGGSTFVCRERDGELSFVAGEDGGISHLAYHLSDDMGRLAGEARQLPHMEPGERLPLEMLLDGETAEATALYRDLLASDPAAEAVAENRLNGLGYRFLQQGRVEAAIAVFSLYADLYPVSANAHDSLGEALMTAGRLDDAVASYRRSIELDPTNSNAVTMIEKIDSMR
jgi:CubicO group peptidase (beta-lactamase class C family)